MQNEYAEAPGLEVWICLQLCMAEKGESRECMRGHEGHWLPHTQS